MGLTDEAQPSAAEALERLKQGNLRFVQGAQNRALLGWHPGIVEGQRPFAVILACSDSRSPAELVFDQGLGDLFVIRIAGNVIAPSGVGSVEFAVSQFGTPLVVVMGHTRCGAVGATLQALEQGDSPHSKNLRSITDRIAPHVQGLVSLATKQGTDRDLLLSEAVRANILASTDQLRHGSRMLEQMVGNGQVVVVGAEYELETGNVNFIDAARALAGR
jgi:carbonic anhydrase